MARNSYLPAEREAIREVIGVELLKISATPRAHALHDRFISTVFWVANYTIKYFVFSPQTAFDLKVSIGDYEVSRRG